MGTVRAMSDIAVAHGPIRLSQVDPGSTGEFSSKKDAAEELEVLGERLEDLQERLYAESQRSMLIVFQAIDTGGKDGMVKHLFRSFNPNGSELWSFKKPTEVELAHDFLWRIHARTPERGTVAVFNRSHYEDVIVTRVHEWIDEAEWERRCDHIMAFERLLSDSGTKVLKFFLHISKDEQKRRLQARLDNPAKHWKFAMGDLDERQRWDRYQETFELVMNRTSTPEAPWYAIPADHKWYRNVAVSRILADALDQMNPQFPGVDFDPASVQIPD